MSQAPICFKCPGCKYTSRSESSYVSLSKNWRADDPEISAPVWACRLRNASGFWKKRPRWRLTLNARLLKQALAYFAAWQVWASIIPVRGDILELTLSYISTQWKALSKGLLGSRSVRSQLYGIVDVGWECNFGLPYIWIRDSWNRILFLTVGRILLLGDCVIDLVANMYWMIRRSSFILYYIISYHRRCTPLRSAPRTRYTFHIPGRFSRPWFSDLFSIANLSLHTCTKCWHLHSTLYSLYAGHLLWESNQFVFDIQLVNITRANWPLRSATDLNTSFMLPRPSLRGNATNDTWASTISPTRNWAGLIST